MSEFEDFLRGLLRNVKQTLARSRELIALVLPLVCKKSVESADGSRAHAHSEATKYGNAIATSSFVSTLTIETPRSRTKPPLFGVRSKNTSNWTGKVIFDFSTTLRKNTKNRIEPHLQIRLLRRGRWAKRFARSARCATRFFRKLRRKRESKS